MQITKSRPRVLGLIVGSTMITLLVAEVCIWIFVPLVDPYVTLRSLHYYIRHAHPPDMDVLTHAEPDLPGMAGVNRWTTNNLGFRGDELTSPKPADEYRIFLIGGSSAECFLLDDQDSLDAVLQRELQAQVGARYSVRVYNAAMSGDGTDDHIAMLTQRIVHLEPDLVVVSAGINDLRAAAAEHDHLHMPMPAPAAWRLLVTESQLGRLAYFLAKGSLPWRDVGRVSPIESTYRTAVELHQAAESASEPPKMNLDAYANNLLTLAGVANSHGFNMVFMTQQTTWNSPSDPSIKNWHWMLLVGNRKYSQASMDKAIQTMNDVMREVAAVQRLALYDAAQSMPKTSQYFYDDVHFNTHGASTAAKGLARVVSQALPR